jgi:hypothetical protein
MERKRGQFYLIAALIIAAIIAGLVTIENFAITRPEPVKFYDLSDAFEKETTKIIDYGVYTPKEIDEQIKNFTENFLEYATEKEKEFGIVYVFGNTTSITILNCAETTITAEGKEIPSCKEAVTSNIGLQISPELKFTRGVVQKREAFEPTEAKIQPSGEIVRVKIGDLAYDFELSENEKFLFRLGTTTSGGEKHIVIKSR